MTSDSQPSRQPHTVGAASPRLARRWIGLPWAILVAGCLAIGLGDRALIDPDEGRSAETALEMVRSGDYLVPSLNGLPHLDKPLLYYAAAALSMRWLGPSALAARLPSLLAAWATLALTVWFSAHLFGRRTAWIAGMAFATAPMAIVMARTAIFDSLLGLFVVLALMAFYRAIESDETPVASQNDRRRSELCWNAIAWASMALGVLTKGPVALVVPLLVAVPFAFLRRRSSVVWHPIGWLLHLAIVAPWVLAVEQRVPGFLRYALVTETWNRLTTGELERGGPIWYFLPYLVAGCFPWILVVAGSARERWQELRTRERRPLVFLGLWMTIPLVFFSLSQSKRPQYILPLVACCALLTAWSFGERARSSRGARAAAIAWAALGSIFLLAASGAVERWLVMPDLPGLRTTVVALGALMTAAGMAAIALSRRPALALAALSVPVAMLPLVTAPLAGSISLQRSGKELAAVIEPHLAANTRIVGIETFSPSLTFYLRRPMEVSTPTGAPLRSNYIVHAYRAMVGRAGSTLRDGDEWRGAMISCAQPTVFLLKPRYAEARSILEAAQLPVLYEDDRLLALGPCRPPVDATATAAAAMAGGDAPTTEGDAESTKIASASG